MPPLYQEQSKLVRPVTPDGNYKSGRSMLAFLEGVGWVLVLVGIMCFGFALFDQTSGPYDPGLSWSMTVAVVSFGAAELVAGFMLAALCRVGLAVFDIADAASSERTTGSNLAAPRVASRGDVARSHRGIEIIKGEDGNYWANNRPYGTISDAIHAIDNSVSSQDLAAAARLRGRRE